MNREIYPGGVTVLSGDVQSQTGNTNVVVVGIQNVPVQSTFLDGGETLSYDPNSHSWVPTIRAAIQVNNVSVSDDLCMSVNVGQAVTVNGA